MKVDKEEEETQINRMWNKGRFLRKTKKKKKMTQRNKEGKNNN